jgi:hypothetical protein
MANQLNPDKERIIYAEWSRVRAELAQIRNELEKKGGREISEAEFLRSLTLNYVNEWRQGKGQEPLDLDPTSPPGGLRRRAAAPQESSSRVNGVILED